jgi:hypothetical protein
MKGRRRATDFHTGPAPYGKHPKNSNGCCDISTCIRKQSDEWLHAENPFWLLRLPWPLTPAPVGVSLGTN